MTARPLADRAVILEHPSRPPMFSRTVRVFLSSTFKDMKEERDALHEVFDRLRARCASDGFQFQAIDLRWGVPEEAALDQRTEELCLEEIRRCRTVSPRPNFVALVGQRYGWRPLPRSLSAADWDFVLPRAGPKRALLEDWYVLDENNEPPVRRLRPRVSDEERGAEFWRDQVETPLRDLLLRCVTEDSESELSAAVRECDISLTEKEIRLGAENAAQEDWQAFAYFRESAGVAREDLKEPFVDRDAAGELMDPDSGRKLADLRRRLEENPHVTTVSRSTTLSAPAEREYLDGLADRVFEDLSAAIDEQIAAYRASDPLDRELEAHAEFAERRLRNYVTREAEREALSYLGGRPARPHVVAGVSGAGKTALLAALARETAARHPDALVVTRFIGATGDSSHLRSLIASVHAEVARRTGSPDLTEPGGWEPATLFQATLAMGTKARPVLVLLDALDQLTADDQALSCGWIPRELHKHCALLVSCMTEEGSEGQAGAGVFADLSGRLGDECVQRVEAPSPADLRSMFDRWLTSFGRRLTDTQRAAVQTAILACPRPLFLRVLVELVRGWSTSARAEGLPRTIPEVISAYLDDLESESRHGRDLVRWSLGLLGASRAGLAESELIDLLDRNEEVYASFVGRSRYEPPGKEKRLPPAVWSSLFFDLDLFLGDTTVNGASLLSFYHRQLAHVARERYVGPEREGALRTALAGYFEDMPTWHAGPGGAPNTRRAYELPHQLRHLPPEVGGPRLRALLGDAEHVEAKLASRLGSDLLADYALTGTVDDGLAEELAATFERIYLQPGSRLAAEIPPDDLHSFLAYRGDVDEKRFYRAFLKLLARGARDGAVDERERRIRARACIDLGGMIRRDGELDEARELLRVLDEPDSGLSLSDRGTGWYEAAYIEYLEDDYERAAELMARSVELAERGGDAVGARISHSVELWARYFSRPGRAALEEMVAEELRSLAVFAERQVDEPKAVRWVMNARAHLVNACYLLGDGAALEEHLRELRANPWVREYESRNYLLSYEARFAMTRGRHAEAVELWERMLATGRYVGRPEGAAWPLLDYGLALLGSGRSGPAAMAFGAALRKPGKGGNNAFWQERAREHLARLPAWARDLA